MIKIKLIESYLLLEDLNKVKERYSWIPANEFETIIRIDPTFREASDNLGQYGRWLLDLYRKKSPKGIPYSEMFQNYNVRNHIEEWLRKYDYYKNNIEYDIEKDIMRFKDHMDLYNAIQDPPKAVLSRKQQAKLAKRKQKNLVFSGDVYDIYQPRDHNEDMELAMFNGSSKATWCTAADSENGEWQWNHYSKDGPIYVVINRENPEEKYQFHCASRQFNNNVQSKCNCIKDVIKKDPKLYDFFDGKEDYNRYMGPRPNEKKQVKKKELSFIEVNIDNIIGARLPEVGDISSLKKKDLKCDYGWWTGTQGMSNKYMTAVYNTGELYDSANVLSSLGIRPILQFDNDCLQTGAHFNIGNSEFISLSEETAISKNIIGSSQYNKDRNSKNPTDYESSDVKKYIDDWLNKLKAQQ